MTRRSGSRGKVSRRTPSPRRSARTRFWVWITTVLAAVAVALTLRSDDYNPLLTMPIRAMQDSATAATVAHDWPRTAYWGQALLRRVPNFSPLVTSMAGVWQNRAFMGEPGGWRAPVRNSLERFELVQLSIATFDSAIACASDSAQRADALYKRASLYDATGLHADALEQYRQVVSLAPTHLMARVRIAGITVRLRDPSHGDSVHVTENGEVE